MGREDFLEAPTDMVGTPSSDGAAPRIRRPLHGGWTLMVAAGLIAATANYALLTMDDPAVEVVVLADAAAAGTPVEELSIEMAPLGLPDPSGAQLLTGPGAIDALAGQVTTSRLEAGVLLRVSDLRVPSGEGMSAMSLPIDPARAVGGALQAGDHVDVIAGEAQAGYVVRDVQIIDVVRPGTGIGAATGDHAVTVSVDADDALRLAQALRTGPLDIVRTGGGDR